MHRLLGEPRAPHCHRCLAQLSVTPGKVHGHDRVCMEAAGMCRGYDCALRRRILSWRLWQHHPGAVYLSLIPC